MSQILWWSWTSEFKQKLCDVRREPAQLPTLNTLVYTQACIYGTGLVLDKFLTPQGGEL